MGKRLDPSDCLVSNTWSGSGDHADGVVALIESRPLVCECIGHALSRSLDREVQTFPTVDEFVANAVSVEPWLIVIGSAASLDLEELSAQIITANKYAQSPVVVMADEEDLGHIRVAIGSGAKGYIPTSVGLDVAVEAIRLVKSGGIYVPATTLVPPSPATYPRETNGAMRSTANAGLLTERQAAVVEALRRGKANKIIAYELNMTESTVKVHVRNIMKKLNAKNRTEVAFIAGEMFDSDAGEMQLD